MSEFEIIKLAKEIDLHPEMCKKYVKDAQEYIKKKCPYGNNSEGFVRWMHLAKNKAI
jgi:hypothetical protein